MSSEEPSQASKSEAAGPAARKASIKKPEAAGERKPSIVVEPTDSKPAVVVVEDDTSSPSSPSSSRRGSAAAEPPNASAPSSRASSRRPSIVIVADEKGIAVDESTGEKKKLRPGEMLEVRRGSRRGSFDMRRASSVEIDRADKPSTPLKALGDVGPPVITDHVDNVSAVENKTAFIQATVEGKPVPKFKFYKDGNEIFEGGRYKVVTDGETNTVYFCIRKAKSNDEGKYKIVAYNEHGEDSCNVKLFVSGKCVSLFRIISKLTMFLQPSPDESGMDFRAMLKSKQYAKWGKDKDDPDWGNLKPTEDERRASLLDTKVRCFPFFASVFVLSFGFFFGCFLLSLSLTLSLVC